MAPLQATGPAAVFWTAPAILLSAILIAWAAESAQYFVAQGFALAILAWLQTAPEFAVEGVLAWHQQVPLLLAGLTGALRLLTGLGWPVIYFTAATMKRRRGPDEPRLKSIRLHEHHSIEVVALMLPLLYFGVITIKASLSVYDGLVLIAMYAAYLVVLSKMPPEDVETLDDLEAIPRRIVTAPRLIRIWVITALFVGGGALIYFSAEPFLASLLAVSTALGVPQFVFVQWIAPLVSEFPEMASTFYWARTVERAPIALMNMVSSNINQWTLLPAMLPILFSFSHGAITPIQFDHHQQIELLLTLGQASVGFVFLLNMELAWWEAAALFVMFLIPFAAPSQTLPVAIGYFAWTGVELLRIFLW